MYKVNYGTGVGDTIHETYEEAVDSVSPCYTCHSITITNDDGDVVAQADWNGVQFDQADYPDEDADDFILADYGDMGFYTNFYELN